MTAKKKNLRRKNNSEIDRLMRQIQQSSLFREDEITFKPNEGTKLSAVIANFIKPYQNLALTDEAYQKLIAIAVIAWNAAILPKAERKELVIATIESIVSTAGEEARKDTEDVLAMLIKHKERYFADDRRLIVDYRLTEKKGKMHLSVASVEKK